jgi:hypothetical protein
MNTSNDNSGKLPARLDQSLKDFFAPIAMYCTKATLHQAEFILPEEVDFDGHDPEGLFTSIQVEKGAIRKRGMSWSMFPLYQLTGETRWRFSY